jgi:hypothetical protein
MNHLERLVLAKESLYNFSYKLLKYRSSVLPPQVLSFLFFCRPYNRHDDLVNKILKPVFFLLN